MWVVLAISALALLNSKNASAQSFTVSVSVDSTRGQIQLQPDQATYSNGTIVSIYAIPKPGFIFQSWTGGPPELVASPLAWIIDGAMVIAHQTSITVNSNKSIGANFSQDSNDSDGDGLSNYQELAIFHTDPQVPETNSPVQGLYLTSQFQSNWTNGKIAGIAAVTGTPNSFGLFTTNQIQNLGLGGIILDKTTNNQLVLKYQVLQSSNLQSWSTYQQNELVISNAPSDKMFLRVQAIEQ